MFLDIFQTVCEMNREKCCPTFCKPCFSHHLRRRSIFLSSIFSPQDKLFMLATLVDKIQAGLKHLPPTGFKSFLLFQEPHLTKPPHEFQPPFEI